MKENAKIQAVLTISCDTQKEFIQHLYQMIYKAETAQGEEDEVQYLKDLYFNDDNCYGSHTVKFKTTFYLYWKTGTRDSVEAFTVSEAYSTLGYDAGALAALDFYSTNPNYKWDSKFKKWVRVLTQKEINLIPKDLF